MCRKKIIVVLGPTGGHYLPGIALGEQLEGSPGVSVRFMTPARPAILARLERKRLPYDILVEARLSGRAAVLFPGAFLRAFAHALVVMFREKPDVVVGMGSYACVPAVLAGVLTGRRTVIHEQNAVAGKATRMLSPLVDTVCLTFPVRGMNPGARVAVTGFPVAEEFRRVHPRQDVLREMGLDPVRRTVLVTGGSQGSRFINRLTVENARWLRERSLQVIHLAGPDEAWVREAYRRCGLPAAVYGFFEDMGRIFSAVDFGVCRSGAGILAEISWWRIPSVVIPYPFAGGHQVANARFLERRDACVVLEQSEDAVGRFPEFFSRLVDRREHIRECLGRMRVVDTEGRFLRCALGEALDG